MSPHPFFPRSPTRRHLARLASAAAAALLLLPAGALADNPTYTQARDAGGIAATTLFSVQGIGPDSFALTRYCEQDAVYYPLPSAASAWLDNDQGPNTRIVGADWGASGQWGGYAGLAYQAGVSADGQQTFASLVETGPAYATASDTCAGINVTLNSVTFQDLQGPAVGGLQVDGAQTGGWFTGPVVLSWDASDNAVLRGTTGAGVDGGASADYGDAPDDVRKVSAPLDPGTDGAHVVTVYRTAPGWSTATQQAPIRVDRDPPSAPLLAPATPDTSAPRVMVASGAGDGAGSGVAGYEFTKDAGRTVNASLVLAEAGQYTVQARAVDGVGHRGAWSAPVSVVVTPRAESPRVTPSPTSGAGGGPESGGDAGPGLGPAGAESPRRVALPDLTNVRLAHLRVSNGRNRVVGPCRGPARPCPRHVVAVVSSDYGRRLSVVGRFSHRNHHGLVGAFVLLRGPSGRPVTSTFTDRHGRFVLSFPARHAGTYRVAAIGQPEVGTDLLVRVRPHVALGGLPAGPLRLGGGRLMVLRGRVNPARWGRTRLAQLEWLNGAWTPGHRPRGDWQIRAQVTTDRLGHFVLPYRWNGGGFAALVRVVVPGDAAQALLRGVSRRVVVVVPA